MVQQWEYALLTEAPSGPMVLTLTLYRTHGVERTIHRARNFDEGSTILRPRVIAELGLAGWEMFAVSTGAWHFKRPIAPVE